MPSSIRQPAIRALLLGIILGAVISLLIAIALEDGGYVGTDKVYPAKRKHTNLSVTSSGDDLRILCWIMTTPKNHQRKAIHIRKTWGPRCNILLFMSSEKDEKLDSIALPVLEGRKHLWSKTKQAFGYIYANHLNDADWFLKADDDTYVVVENLRLMLKNYSPETPIYFGCKFKHWVKQGYMSGGAGYVLSREAVRRFVELGTNSKWCANKDDGPEDVEIGWCMQNLFVRAGDSRDALGRGRFYPFSPVKIAPWYWTYIFYPSNVNRPIAFSEYMISFHYVDDMYALEYLIYYVRKHGTTPQNCNRTAEGILKPQITGIV